MNQTVVDEIAKQLNVVNEIPEVKQIIERERENCSQFHLKNFSADYLNAEWTKIESARAKDYPTYRSEYRVVKTLIRLRNQIIYQLKMRSPMHDTNADIVSAGFEKFVTLSKSLLKILKAVGDVFETEKTISNFAAEFDNSWK